MHARGPPQVARRRRRRRDEARGGEMAAENKPEGKREITILYVFVDLEKRHGT